jgi:hypothetical protein
VDVSAALLALDAQLLDGMTWLLAVRSAGIGGESNPIAIAAHGAGGLELVLVAKLVGAVLCAAIAWRLAGRRWALLPAIVGLVGALTNIGAVA